MRKSPSKSGSGCGDGLNLGDVMVRDGDIFGDAVNVAARLQSLAEPGSVYSSAAVVDQLRGHVGFAWDDLGEKSLKNISRPVKVFRLAPASPTTTPPPGSAKSWHFRIMHLVGAGALAAILVAVAYGWLRAPAPATTPSLAVLPFTNQSGDPADVAVYNCETPDCSFMRLPGAAQAAPL
jgi:adenylate cyclase